jgi:hypothetical protein
MDQATHNKIVSFLWGIADDVLRDLFKRGKYPDVILPMGVLRRLTYSPPQQSFHVACPIACATYWMAGLNTSFVMFSPSRTKLYSAQSCAKSTSHPPHTALQHWLQM